MMHIKIILLLLAQANSQCSPDGEVIIPEEKYKGVIIGLSVLSVFMVVCICSYAGENTDPERTWLLHASVICMVIFIPMFFAQTATWNTLIHSRYYLDTNITISGASVKNAYCCSGGNRFYARVCINTCAQVTMTVNIVITKANRINCSYVYSTTCGPDNDAVNHCLDDAISRFVSRKLRAHPNNFKKLTGNFLWTPSKLAYLSISSIFGFLMILHMFLALLYPCITNGKATAANIIPLMRTGDQSTSSQTVV